MTIKEINQKIEQLQHDIDNNTIALKDIRGRLIESVGSLLKDQIIRCIEARVKDEYPHIIVEMDADKQKDFLLKIKALQRNAQNIIKDLFESRRFLLNNETPNYYYSYMIEQELESEILEYASVHIGSILGEFEYILGNDHEWCFNDKASGYTKRINIDEKIRALITEYAAQNTKLSANVCKVHSYSNEKVKLQAIDLWDHLINIS